MSERFFGRLGDVVAVHVDGLDDPVTYDPCAIDGHDFAIAPPVMEPDGRRIYDLICHRCGEYRQVMSA